VGLALLKTCGYLVAIHGHRELLSPNCLHSRIRRTTGVFYGALVGPSIADLPGGTRQRIQVTAEAKARRMGTDLGVVSPAVWGPWDARGIWKASMRMTAAITLACLFSLALAGCARDRAPRPPLSLAGAEDTLSAENSAPGVASGTSETPGHAGQAQVLFVAYVPTPPDVVDRMLRMARVTRNDVLYDLGCGDGRIVVTAARRYGCRAVGYDLDHLRVQEARRNVQKHGVTHLATIELKDVLNVDLRKASVIALYMGTEMNARLIPQLRTLAPGSRIVSHDFGLGDIPPDKVAEMSSRHDDRRHKIYLWNCPLPAATR